MWERRTDLAAESMDLAQKGEKNCGELRGVRCRERRFGDFSLTEVEIFTAEGAAKIGKPVGRYVTIDLPPEQVHHQFDEAVTVLAAEIHGLMPSAAKSVLVIGLGNADLTADAVGPLAVRYVLPTRHLKGLPFSASLSVTAAEVVGKTGIEAAEQAVALTKTLGAEAVILIDALAAQSAQRLCRTAQLTDSGLVPGSGVGNHRVALNRETLGVPVIAMGVPTVVEGAGLVMDLLEEAGVPLPREHHLRQGFFVTPKDIDEQVQQLSRLIGWSINAAVLGLSPAESAALLG